MLLHVSGFASYHCGHVNSLNVHMEFLKNVNATYEIKDYDECHVLGQLALFTISAFSYLLNEGFAKRAVHGERREAGERRRDVNSDCTLFIQ